MPGQAEHCSSAEAIPDVANTSNARTYASSKITTLGVAAAATILKFTFRLHNGRAVDSGCEGGLLQSNAHAHDILISGGTTAMVAHLALAFSTSFTCPTATTKATAVKIIDSWKRQQNKMGDASR